MKQFLYTLFGISICLNGFAEERKSARQRYEAIGYSTRDATVLSMMGWGVILGVVAAGVSVLFNEAESTTSNSNSNNNNNAH
ncbi:MAG: hypothetical protein HY069_03940 [Chlamydiia bacterium]|nr:hypothetical protein [Chlamydiia bacterium]